MKLALILTCVLMTAFSVAAQDNSTKSSSSGDDYKKTEWYIGYSHTRHDTTPLNGVTGAGVFNFSRYFGVKGEVSAGFNSRRYGLANSVGGLPYNANFRVRQSLATFLGGIQIKDNANKGRFKPFGHVLIGAARATSKTGDFVCSPTANCPTFATGTFKNTSFSAVVGGGVDYRVNKKLQVRLIQVDYNPVRNGFGGTSNHIRLGAGIVF